MRFELPHVEQIGSKASLRHRVKWRGVSHDMLDQYRNCLDQLCINVSFK